MEVEDQVEDLGLKDPNVVTKYKAAAEVANGHYFLNHLKCSFFPCPFFVV